MNDKEISENTLNEIYSSVKNFNVDNDNFVDFKDLKKYLEINSKDVDIDIVDVVNEHFWDLI